MSEKGVLLRLNEDLHYRLKCFCVINRTSIQELGIKAIERFLEESGNGNNTEHSGNSRGASNEARMASNESSVESATLS